MRFKLKPNNRGAADGDLLDDLRIVAHSLGKSYVTKSEYQERGRFNPATLRNRFGSWCKAHELAGLHRIRNFQMTPEDCLKSLRRVAEKLGKKTITTKEYLGNGGFSLRIISRHFGSWKTALERASLAVSPLYRECAKEDQLFENIEKLWVALGRQPNTNDFSEALSQFSVAPYKRRFGSLRKALEAFVESRETSPEEAEAARPEILAAVSPSSLVKRHKTSRTVTNRMRFRVWRRDGFKCQICGYAPATHPGTILEVDHVIPWDSGGETVMENLQTLCQRCNSGKSNLAMRETVLDDV